MDDRSQAMMFLHDRLHQCIDLCFIIKVALMKLCTFALKINQGRSLAAVGADDRNAAIEEGMCQVQSDTLGNAGNQ